jgi:RimJ/RimL family protein N-acetyltransferase
VSRADLALRPAGYGDCEQLRAWRNDPDTVAASNGREVEPSEHAAWLEAKLADPGCRLWIVERAGTPIGQVRAERLDGGDVELHIGLGPDARGQGTGTQAIHEAVSKLPSEWGATGVVARVRPDNQASLRAFAKAGFVDQMAGPELLVLRRER